MSNDLIHDIEDSIKRERMEKLWKEYGGYLIAGVILAIIMTALLTAWRSWDHRINTQQTNLLVEALNNDNFPEALQAFADDLRTGHETVARLTAAGLLAREGRHEEALAHYNKIAAQRGTDAAFRDLATVMVVRIAFDLGEDDDSGTYNPRDLLARLAPIAGSNRNPWRHHARLQAALIYADDLQDYQEARARLEQIIRQDDIPASLRERAESLSHLYMLKYHAARAESAQESEG